MINRLLEEFLRNPSAFFKLIEVMPVGLIVTDANGIIQLANPASKAILGGMVAGSATGAIGGAMFHHADGTLIMPEERPLARVLRSGEMVENVEMYVRGEAGQPAVILVSASPLKDGEGKLLGAVATFIDITVRKQDEAKICENEETIKALLNGITEAMVLINGRGDILTVNETAAARLHRSAEEMIGANLYSIIPAQLAEHRKSIIDKVIHDKLPIRFQDTRAGRMLDNNVYPVLDSNGHVTKVAFFSQDVTERRQVEEALRESEERFRNAFENSANGMAIVSMAGRWLKVNQVLCEIVGYPETELLNTTFQALTHPDDLTEDLTLVEALKQGEIRSYNLEKRYIHKAGHVVWVLLSVSLVKDAEGRPLYFISQIEDITARKKGEEDLYKAKLEADQARERAELLARTDYLTGLLNRRAFAERFEAEAGRISRERTQVSLIMADIDRFKLINDTFGHQAGDTVLREFSACLSEICRSYDFLGRHGGEEFVICLPSTNNEQALQIAERMRSAVEQLTIVIPELEQAIRITASFGVTTSQAGLPETLHTLITKADNAMYQAKAEGRNRVMGM